MGRESLQHICEDHIVIRFKQLFCPFSAEKLDSISDVYAETIVFRDPVQQLHGLNALYENFLELSQAVDFCSFDYLDETLGDGYAFITWDMLFRHRYLAAGRELKVRGISHVKFTDTIYYHEDFYDMGAMLYDNVPLLGGMTRWFKRRLQRGQV